MQAKNQNQQFDQTQYELAKAEYDARHKRSEHFAQQLKDMCDFKAVSFYSIVDSIKTMYHSKHPATIETRLWAIAYRYKNYMGEYYDAAIPFSVELVTRLKNCEINKEIIENREEVVECVEMLPCVLGFASDKHKSFAAFIYDQLANLSTLAFANGAKYTSSFEVIEEIVIENVIRSTESMAIAMPDKIHKNIVASYVNIHLTDVVVGRDTYIPILTNVLIDGEELRDIKTFNDDLKDDVCGYLYKDHDSNFEEVTKELMFNGKGLANILSAHEAESAKESEYSYDNKKLMNDFVKIKTIISELPHKENGEVSPKSENNNTTNKRQTKAA